MITFISRMVLLSVPSLVLTTILHAVNITLLGSEAAGVSVADQGKIILSLNREMLALTSAPPAKEPVRVILFKIDS